MAEPNDVLARPERLAAIAASDLLETGALPALDRVVRAAARLLDAPVAQLNVVTADRQIPVSYVGSEAWGRPVGLDRSYCRHAVARGEPLAVEDARAHPLVAASPATRESGIVGYLSVPLLSPRAPDPLATLCVVDFRPRAWTGHETEILADLAAWALSEIELRAASLRDRARADEALRESEARYRAFTDLSPDATWVSQDGRLVYANRAAARVIGAPDADRLIGRETLDFAMPEHRALVRAILESRASQPLAEVRYRRLDGTPIDVETAAVAIPWQGRPAIQAIFRDVTGRKRAEAERERLIEAERAAREAAERAAEVTSLVTTHLAEGVCLMDAAGRLTYMNPAAERILGWTQGEIEGKVLHDTVHYMHPDGAPFPIHECPLGQVLEAARPVLGYVDQWIRKDGRFVPLVTTCAPLVSQGRVVGAVLSMHDDTERRRAEAERERLLEAEHAARTDAEAANRAKTEFLAVMSHELRTPLNAIGGYTELLEMGIHGPVTGAQRTALGRIQQSQRHLLGLINEVLNYARLETGSVRYDLDDVRVQEAFASVAALVEPQARARSLALDVRDPPPGLAVRADAEKLRQILINLLGNAIKFTDRGGRVELTGGAEGGGVSLSVRDTGIGIPADKLETIFEPFVQVRSDLTRPADGTGLGLAISRDLARGMGGELTVVSAPGQGSRFTLTLPAARADAS